MAGPESQVEQHERVPNAVPDGGLGLGNMVDKPEIPNNPGCVTVITPETTITVCTNPSAIRAPEGGARPIDRDKDQPAIPNDLQGPH